MPYGSKLKEVNIAKKIGLQVWKIRETLRGLFPLREDLPKADPADSLGISHTFGVDCLQDAKCREIPNGDQTNPDTPESISHTETHLPGGSILTGNTSTPSSQPSKSTQSGLMKPDIVQKTNFNKFVEKNG